MSSLTEAQDQAANGFSKPSDKGDFLGPHDVVGTTFYIACNMMLAFTLFFLVQTQNVPKRWRASVTAAALVTGVAFYNYCYMKDVWVHTQTSPTTYRYTDWLITVPIQIVEFYLILKASNPDTPSSLGTKLGTASVAMVACGWLAEIDVMAKLVGFILGCMCWLYIVYETNSGEAAALASTMKSQASRDAFNYVKMIVSIGWIIYPAGYAIAYIIPGPTVRPHGEGPPYDPLNILYNLADLVNKGAFGMAIYSAAASDNSEALLG